MVLKYAPNKKFEEMKCKTLFDVRLKIFLIISKMKQNVRKTVKKPPVPPRSRSRKGMDEQEKLVVGAGWTTAAIQHFIELQEDDERLDHVKAMFNINPEDYKYKLRYTNIVDFHFANGLFCLEKNYDISQFQFICKSIGSLFDMVVYAASSLNPNRDQPTPVTPTSTSRGSHGSHSKKEPKPIVIDPINVNPNPNGDVLDLNDVDALRQVLMDKFQAMYFDYNGDEFKFTTEQTQEILKFFSMTFIRPIRLIIHTYQSDPYKMIFLEMKRVFTPPAVLPPMSEFVQQYDELPEEDKFHPLYYPKFSGLTLADVREAMNKYTDQMIETINKRYDHLENMVQKLTNPPSP